MKRRTYYERIRQTFARKVGLTQVNLSLLLLNQEEKNGTSVVQQTGVLTTDIPETQTQPVQFKEKSASLEASALLEASWSAPVFSIWDRMS